MSIRVVVVDDHRLVRAGIAALLGSIDDVQVLAEGANGQEALALAAEHQPDILLLDLAMPLMSGFEALPELRAAHPEMRIVVLSMHASEEYVIRALNLGANGYLLKDMAPNELAQAVQAVVRGETWLSSPLSESIIDSYVLRTMEKPSDTLTRRQLEVLRMIAEGLGTRDMAEALNLSPKTIETYRAQIMDRLGIHDVPGLVKFAIRSGLVRL